MKQKPSSMLEMLGKMLSPGYNIKPYKKSGMRFKPQMKPQQSQKKDYRIANPLEAVFSSLRSVFSQAAKRNEKENYYEIVNGFIPANAALLTPRNQSRPGALDFIDLDGDSKSELVASYKLDKDIHTIVLKKNDGSWSKVNEISHSGHKEIKYRGYADLKGDGVKNILLGMVPDEGDAVLYGYSLKEQHADELFKRKYQSMDIFTTPPVRDSSGRTQLVFWNRTEEGLRSIEVSNWNGTKLESGESEHYYLSRVIPYYAQIVRQTPYSVEHWYGLADALSKVGARNDALMAVEMGRRVDIESRYIDKFNELRKSIVS